MLMRLAHYISRVRPTGSAWSALALAVIVLSGSSVSLALTAEDTRGVAATHASPLPGVRSDGTPVLAPHLQTAVDEAVRRNVANDLSVIVHSDRHLDLSKYASAAKSVPWVDGYVTFARIDARLLTKVAQLEGVSLIEDPLGDQQRIVFDDEVLRQPPSIEEQRARLAELAAKERTYQEARAVDRAPAVIAERQAVRGAPSISPATARAAIDRGDTPEGWWDVESANRIKQAWDRGFRGQGVRVAIIDSGTDFAHPDLQGTWVVITDTQSPYYGWPQAFDPLGMVAYVADVTTGSSNAELGASALISMNQTSGLVGTRSYDDIINRRGRACFATLMQPAAVGGIPPAIGVRAQQATCDWKVPAISISGQYRFGSHPDRHLGMLYGERPGVLLVDANARGMYDTVYVDLDNDHDFTDEKPVTVSSPLSYRDMDGDGLADLGGGLLYFISDGRAPIPGAWIFPTVNLVPPAGRVIGLIGDFDSTYVGWHGTLCASNVVGKGRTPVADDLNLRFRNIPGDGRPKGVVSGAAPDAMVVAIGERYGNVLAGESAYRYIFQGTDPVSAIDDVQVSTHSYTFGSGAGWGTMARFIDRLVTTLDVRHSMLFAAANGGPGYSTQGSPDSHVSMQIAASAQYGSTGWDSITDTSQILYGDLISFSSRGPSRDGTAGPEVAANGGWGSGALALSSILDGLRAWETWGGTSRATPLAGGQMALIYQAYKATHGEWPSRARSRSMMMGGARWMGYDTFSMGSGLTDAGMSTALATGRDGLMAMPPDWVAGDWKGQEYPAFPNIMYRGSSDSTTIELRNPTDRPIQATISANHMRRIGGYEFTWSSQTITAENESALWNLHAPDYLIPITRTLVPAGTDLMVVRMAYPRDQFAGGRNIWRLSVFQHTDIDGDRRLWEDRDEDLIVDHYSLPTSHIIDGHADLDWARGEADRYEYNRFSMAYQGRNSQNMFVHRPLERWRDGLYIGLQHSTRTPVNQPGVVPITDMMFSVEFYAAVPWPWLTLETDAPVPPTGGTVTIPANGETFIRASLDVPGDASVGFHDGMISLEYEGRAAYDIFVPNVSKQYGADQPDLASVRSQQSQGSLWPRQLTIPVHAVVAAQADLSEPSQMLIGADDRDALYNRGAVASSVDRRYFFAEVEGAPAGSRLVTVAGPSENTAADTVVQVSGPAPDRFTDPQHPANAEENWADPRFYGPYTLALLGSSVVNNVPQTWFSARAQQGLHLLEVQKSLFPGPSTQDALNLSLSSARIQPGEVETQEAGCVDLQFSSGLPLTELQTAAVGLAPRFTYTGRSQQDNPNDPSSAGYKHTFNVMDTKRLTAVLDGPEDGTDLDLFVLRDANGDGVFAYPGERLGESTTPIADESVIINDPPNGRYAVWVQGWAVAPAGATFTLTIDTLRGNDITIQTSHEGPVAPGQNVDLQACLNVPPGATGQLLGEITLGPPQAPRLIDVPVRVTR